MNALPHGLQVRARQARQHADCVRQQLWAAQQELQTFRQVLSLSSDQSSEANTEDTVADDALFEAIMRLGTTLERPLRPACSAVNADSKKLAWVQDPEVVHL